MDNTMVDSLTFSKTRNEINELPNAMFEKHIFKAAEKGVALSIVATQKLQ
ncbi:hypothetical protein [Myroides odoratus]